MNFERLVEVFHQYGLPLEQSVVQNLEVFWQQVVTKAAVMDLTTILADEEAWAKHFLDSYAPVFFQQQYGYCISKKDGFAMDLGTGAGFPGVPLGLYFSNMVWYLVDARQKKIAFLQEALAKMEQKHFKPEHTRIEDLIRLHPHLRGHVTVVTTRAIKLETSLLKVVYDLLAVGGVLIQYAGPSAGELLFYKNKEMKQVADFCPQLHSLTENHRIRVYEK